MPHRRRARSKSVPKVLVVDVDRRRVDEIASHLRQHGFAALPCLRPGEVIGRMRRERPDAVVLEVIMPRLSGFEIAARMQADPRLSHIPIFFTTDIQDSLGDNSDYFPRPLDKDALVRSLTRHVEAASRRAR